MIPTRFIHVALSCKDPIAIESFYTKHFGFKRARVVVAGSDQVVFIKSGEMYLELFKAEGEAPALPLEKDGPHYAGWRHIAFTVDNVDAKIEQMGEAARISLGPLSFDEFIPGWRTVWVSDPEGNIIEITQGYADQHDPPLLE